MQYVKAWQFWFWNWVGHSVRDVDSVASYSCTSSRDKEPLLLIKQETLSLCYGDHSNVCTIYEIIHIPWQASNASFLLLCWSHWVPSFTTAGGGIVAASGLAWHACRGPCIPAIRMQFKTDTSTWMTSWDTNQHVQKSQSLQAQIRMLCILIIHNKQSYRWTIYRHENEHCKLMQKVWLVEALTEWANCISGLRLCSWEQEAMPPSLRQKIMWNLGIGSSSAKNSAQKQ